MKDRQLPLTGGTHVIGRTGDAHLAIDDSGVSRRHAAVHVDGESMWIEDLGSLNGTFVDGKKIEGKAGLGHGTRITIGGHDLFVIERNRLRRERMQTMEQRAPAAKRPPTFDEAEVAETQRSRFYELLLQQAGQLLERGDAERAAKVGRELFTSLQTTLASTGFGDRHAIQAATRHALQLAERTGGAEWLDRIFELHAIEPRLLPVETIESIHRIARSLGHYRPKAFAEYLTMVERQAEHFGPHERFLMSRLKSLAQALGFGTD